MIRKSYSISFRQIDLSLIAEKQALLMGLKALSSTLKTHDLSQLQTMLGSSNDIETLKKWLSNQDGSMKWEWMNHFPKLSLLEQLTKLTPLASAGIGAVYSHRFVNDVNQKAQSILACSSVFAAASGSRFVAICCL